MYTRFHGNPMIGFADTTDEKRPQHVTARVLPGARLHGSKAQVASQGRGTRNIRADQAARKSISSTIWQMM